MTSSLGRLFLLFGFLLGCVRFHDEAAATFSLVCRLAGKTNAPGATVRATPRKREASEPSGFSRE
jgi:hypothetical protein